MNRRDFLKAFGLAAVTPALVRALDVGGRAWAERGSRTVEKKPDGKNVYIHAWIKSHGGPGPHEIEIIPEGSEYGKTWFRMTDERFRFEDIECTDGMHFLVHLQHSAWARYVRVRYDASQWDEEHFFEVDARIVS